jgi:hypothetical protein
MLRVVVSATERVWSSDDWLNFEAGDSSSNFIVVVPVDANLSWQVSYGSWAADYVATGYYSLAGTTWDRSSATLLAGGQDHTDIALTLMTGNKISGSLSLPSGQVASTYMRYRVIVEQASGNEDRLSYETFQFIPEGISTTDYALTVPAVDSLSWRVYYMDDMVDLISTGSEYLAAGYYAAAGTTWKLQDATILSGGEEHSGIDVTLLTGPTITISGTISLPPGIAVAPGESISINIYDDTAHAYFSSVFHKLARDTTSLDYTVEVPQGTAEIWKVGYRLWYGGDLLQNGYYTPTITVRDYEAAAPLSSDQDHGNINMTLLRAAGKFPWSMFLPAIIGRVTP